MVTLVILTNCLLALACLALAGRLWQLRRSLQQLRWMMGDVAHNTEAALQGATEALVAGQQSTQRLQWRYRKMQHQLVQLQQLLLLASWTQRLLLRRIPRRARA
jgi:hypothetical protein